MAPDDGEGPLASEIAARRAPTWEAPFHWWGPAWHRPEPRTVGELVADAVLTRETAERLRGEVASGRSVVVAASPSRVGKSTLAAALIADVPAERRRVFLRGLHETFDFLSAVTPARATLLVNELSPHLPIYLWGDAARRALTLAAAGAQLLATIHADTPEEVVYQLARAPVAASPAEIAALGTLVFLAPPDTDADRWRVARLVRLAATPHGVKVVDSV